MLMWLRNVPFECFRITALVSLSCWSNASEG